MANREAAELREMADPELETRLGEMKQELFNLRFQLVTGQQENTARLGQTKRTIARIETILREREIDAAEAAERSRVMVPSGADAAEAATGEESE